MSKKDEIMQYLHLNVFDPILTSKKASESLKKGVRMTIIRMNERDAKGMLQYYWSAIVGTEKSTKFAKMMKDEGFTRFEELLEDFREKFTEKWLRTP